MLVTVRTRSGATEPNQTRSNPFQPMQKMQHLCKPVSVQTRTHSNAFRMSSKCIQNAIGTRSGMQQIVAFYLNLKDPKMEGFRWWYRVNVVRHLYFEILQRKIMWL